MSQSNLKWARKTPQKDTQNHAKQTKTSKNNPKQDKKLKTSQNESNVYLKQAKRMQNKPKQPKTRKSRAKRRYKTNLNDSKPA